MTPIVKDPENAAAPAAPGIPATPAGAPARPQPVALEVPVTVNGARSVEGSDKREPFSEHSQTVLVFGHGAVLRISAMLAPGQLVFLTNEKTKKEVVCVVVKSKTDGNAVGYVELRFTEPSPGFWGMRFPSDTVLPQAATRPPGPASAPVTPKAPAVAPPATPPVAVKPVTPPPPIAVTPVVAASRAPVSITPEISKVPTPPQAVAPPVSLQSAPAGEVAVPSVASSPLFAPAEKKPALSSTTVTTPNSSPQSTDELKQQAARLQEQLSSLLFAEAPKPAASTPEPVLASTTTPELAQKVLDLTNFTAAPVPSQPVKNVAPPPKARTSSLQVEEIKIPSWLAPLAHESETPAASHSSRAESNSFAEVEAVVAESVDERISPESQESTHRPEVAIFGGQLLGESSQSADAASSGSKAGLFLGIAASLLLVAGGVWYSRQPGNAISGLLGGSSTASQPVASSPVTPEPAVTRPVLRPEPAVAAASSSPVPSAVSPPAPAFSAPVKNTPAAPISRNANPIVTPSATPAPRDTPPVEEPKKSALGDVRLATPVFNHGKTSSAPSESEPSLDVSANASTAAPLSGLSTSHRNEPAAPIPVGGDVKPAKLIKSVQPVYPQMARTQHVSGNVQIDALIDADGNVSAMKVLSGPALLRDAALQSLKQWKYQPAELDGKPTSMHLTVVLQFRAQ
jgi:TonB family protein